MKKSPPPKRRATASHSRPAECGAFHTFLSALQMRGTSGTPRRTKRSRYRCSLPGLAGFAGLRRTEPEVPRIGSRATWRKLLRQSSTALRPKKEIRPEGSGVAWTALFCAQFFSLGMTDALLLPIQITPAPAGTWYIRFNRESTEMLADEKASGFPRAFPWNTR
jgi:hypothetical protein